MYNRASHELIQYCNVPMKRPPQTQYILRMLVRSPATNNHYVIPDELKWLEMTIHTLHILHGSIFPAHNFTYITVRNGKVKSEYDDEWHVDGFSMRYPHVPEQSFIYSDSYPTEFLAENFEIPADFNPLRHNLHHYFQDYQQSEDIIKTNNNVFTLIDPYLIHRRPSVPCYEERIFIRVSFVPREIEDDSCTQNPLLPVKKYNRSDIRNILRRYPNDK